MMEDQIKKELLTGDMSSLDAIQALEKLSYLPKDAEALVDEWIENAQEVEEDELWWSKHWDKDSIR